LRLKQCDHIRKQLRAVGGCGLLLGGRFQGQEAEGLTNELATFETQNQQTACWQKLESYSKAFNLTNY
jgi:hypothetical protein